MKIEYPIAKYTIMIHLHSHSSSVIKPSQAMGVTWLDSEVVRVQWSIKYLFRIAQNRGIGKISFKNTTMKILKRGNKACLELFHKKDFPCMKIGRAFGITEENFVEYFKTRRVEDDERGN